MKQAETLSIAKERTYVLLRNALFGLMMTKPFEKITLTDICKIAMIPRSTFYRHFEDKYALLHYCFDFFCGDAGIVLDSEFIKNPAHTKQFFITLFEYLEKHKSTYKRMINNNRQSTALEYMREYVEQMILKNSLLVFPDCVPNGLPRDMFAHVTAGIILAAGHSYLESDEAYPVEELATCLTHCTYHGLLD